MCGFAGVIAWDERYRVSRETLAKMSARIAHRGPDGEGTYFSPDAEITPDRPQVALAHRRLAILDPDPRANQPFIDKAGRWLVYNGEIYNFRELRAELSRLQPNYEWRTNCDTEVLLVAYDQWGEKCVEHFNGMFAFAIWDEPRKQLFAAIDRMGQKPLYWTAIRADGTQWTGAPGQTLFPNDNESRRLLMLGERAEITPPLAMIAFSSELPALTVIPGLWLQIDRAAFGCYLRWGYIASAKTIFSTIRKFEPSTCGFVGSSAVWTAVYFNEKVSDTSQKSDALRISDTRTLVRRAVQRQLVADVPIGCLLSGGVDSSVIAAVMKATVPDGQRVMTFTAAFEDARYDESEYAAQVASHLGTLHHRFLIQPDIAADLPALAVQFGEPFGDSSALPTYYLARETRKHVKVALGGDGGDELFGGYDRYQAMRASAIFDHLADSFRHFIASDIWQSLPGTHPKSKLARLKRFLQMAKSGDRVARYLDVTQIFPLAMLKQLLPLDDQSELHWWEALMTSWADRVESNSDAVEMATALDRKSYLPFDLLVKIDRASMSHALEVRSPFMDHELVQFAAGLTTDQLLKGGPKRMLREAFAQDLPAWVFKRKKMGFAVPIGDWFRGELRPMLRDHLFANDSFAASHFNMPVVQRLVDEHETMRYDHSQRLYALLMLELWWKTQITAP